MENKKLIILVDDNPTNLRLGINVLDKTYRVATAPSAKKLFEILDNNYPALILLDIDMPEMNGYEAIKILKSKPDTKNIPVIFLTAKTESNDELEGLTLGAVDYITKPFHPALLLKRIETHLLMEIQRKTMSAQTAELQYLNDNLQKMVDEKTKDIIELQNALLKTMAEMVEYRDHVTGGHIERTQQGIKIMLDEIKKRGLFSEETKGWNTELLLHSCQLHDVGKISVSDFILKKPAKLDALEIEEMKIHVDSGEKIIKKIASMTKESDFLKYAEIFAASHHERWDGKGYPRGLKGKEIPLLGRIMAIADVYDALISERPYKKPFTHEESVKIISESKETQFDPDLIKLFVEAADRFKGISSS